MILGLDISTSITGYTVIDYEGGVVACNHIYLRKEKNFFKKVRLIQSKLLIIDETHEIEEIYIEQSLQSFRSGFSSAQTLSLLSKINGIVSWLFYELFEIEPEYVGATAARKEAGIKIPRGTKAKKVVMEHLLENESAFKVEYTRHGNPKAQYFDMADAIIVARAGYRIEQKKQEKT